VVCRILHVPDRRETPLSAGTDVAEAGDMLLARLVAPVLALIGCGSPLPPRRPEVDVTVVAVDLTPAPAGQPSDARVTIANHGTRPLNAQDYVIRIDAPGSPEEMRRNACAGQRTHVFIDAPVDIAPGQMEMVVVHHIFARAGRFPITARVTLELREDGMADDDQLTIHATVPPSPCAGGQVASR
jgi:hypothetical protein